MQILQNNADGTSKGSLLWLMDHTNTAFGGRLLHHWVSLLVNTCDFLEHTRILSIFLDFQLIHPLCDQSLISNRLDAVSEIVDTMGSVADNESEGSFPGSRRGGGSLGSMSRGSNSKSMLGVVLMALKKAPDIERGITRIFHGTANPSEVKFGFSSKPSTFFIRN
jgi:DNA mismatch repair protein MSH3